MSKYFENITMDRKNNKKLQKNGKFYTKSRFYKIHFIKNALTHKPKTANT